MNELTLKFGFFRRKVKFRFDLAALKSATVACKHDLGDFFTSKNISESHRFFYHSYGAWLMGRNHDPKLLNQYSLLFKKFNFEHIHKIEMGIKEAEIMSSELRKYLSSESKSTGEKKKQ